MKIGILGGTFNPIHKGHIEMAIGAKKAKNLDQIWFIPAGTPPHKKISSDISSRRRYEMCSIALQAYPDFYVRDDEIYSDQPNYTYQTLGRLKNLYPDYEFYFIMGEDSVDSFYEWKYPEKILEYAHLLVTNREQTIEASLNLKIERIIKRYGGEISSFSMESQKISSTEIRKFIYNEKKTDNIKCYLQDSVYHYIVYNGLYRNKYNLDIINELDVKLKQELKNSRYNHSIGVMHVCAALAMVYDYPIERAMIAGLMHDCAKCISDHDLLSFCEENRLSTSYYEKAAPYLLHGKVGAHILESKYHITDDEIQHAITVHTTGCKKMNLLDKILFVADYIEPGRKSIPQLNDIRYEAFHSIDHAVMLIMESTINYLKESNKIIDKTTIETYQYYKEQEANNGTTK